MSLDRIQRSRIEAAKALLETFEGNRGAPDLGDMLVKTYLKTGKGDKLDIKANIIDIVADVGFAVQKVGGDFSKIVSDVRRANNSSTEVELILALKSAYRPQWPGYKRDYDFDDLVRIGADHVGVESTNADIADYGRHPIG